jgi:hypothetical protein
MARTLLVKTTALGPYGAYTANAADLTMAAAAAVADKNYFVSSGRDLVVAHNTGAGARTITITSVADPHYGRTGDILTYSLGAGEYAVFGPFPLPGWQQSTGQVYLEASDPEVKFGVVALPAI